jgi:hypothetical protein
MHGGCPQVLGSVALIDHRSAGGKPNYGSGGYPGKDAATPRNEEQIGLLGHR